MRALRRYHRQRMIAKAKKIYPWCKVPQKLADNLAHCSCSGCGNPRHAAFNKGWQRMSKQERYAFWRYQEQLVECAQDPVVGTVCKIVWQSSTLCGRSIPLGKDARTAF